MAKLNLKWGKGNTKVMKLEKVYGKTVTFDLPAYESRDGFRVCPGAKACAAICYARQGHFVRGVVQRAFEHNLKLARGNPKSFARMAIADLQLLKAKLVRLHSSGDFFRESYFRAWCQVAKALPGIRFYAYTKSFGLWNMFADKPENLIITQSQGGTHDAEIDMSKPHSRIFASDADRKRAGYQNGSNTDILAIRGANKIALIYHGTRNLTPAQEKFFS